jgi:hypothetical protein
MNAGIVMLDDDTPCIAYDEELPGVVDCVEFNPENHQLTLVYEKPDANGNRGYEFSFPLDPLFTALLRERVDVAVAYLTGDQLVDIKRCIVNFIP